MLARFIKRFESFNENTNFFQHNINLYYIIGKINKIRKVIYLFNLNINSDSSPTTNKNIKSKNKMTWSTGLKPTIQMIYIFRK
jgi:oligoribonuclease NrnB/cAMP/cGMP phosphodiesterase (DHH superfamily)